MHTETTFFPKNEIKNKAKNLSCKKERKRENFSSLTVCKEMKIFIKNCNNPIDYYVVSKKKLSFDKS